MNLPHQSGAILVMAFVLLLLPVHVSAQNLTEIDRGDTPGRIYIDFESVLKDQDFVFFWYVLDIYSAHRNEGTRVYGYHELKPIEYYRSNKMKIMIDCRKRKWKLIDLEAFDQAAAQGPRVGRHKPLKNEEKWRKISSGDTFNLLYPHVCGA